MSASTTAIIAEDEPVLRAELKETLSALWPDLVITAETGDGIETLHALDRHAPDILFLDIQMPGLSGLEVAHQASGRCHVVFVTAYDKYAISAFEEGAVRKHQSTARKYTRRVGGAGGSGVGHREPRIFANLLSPPRSVNPRAVQSYPANSMR